MYALRSYITSTYICDRIDNLHTPISKIIFGAKILSFDSNKLSNITTTLVTSTTTIEKINPGNKKLERFQLQSKNRKIKDKEL